MLGCALQPQNYLLIRHMLREQNPVGEGPAEE